MRIAINLATRPFANIAPALKKLRIAMGVLAVVAIALGLGLHAIDQKAKAARLREQVLVEEIARINQERAGYQALMREPQNAAVLAQAENLNQLFDTKAFSWTLAMEDLETVLPGGVQVTTLEPTRDDKDGHITVRLRVLGPRDRAIEMVQNLEHSRRFLRPRIVSESAETTGVPGQRVEPVSASNRVNVDVLADYNPAGPGEHRRMKPAGGATGNEGQQRRQAPVTPPGQHRIPYMGTSRPPAGLREPQQGGPR
jgi:type IV pilus assembly protein PilN